MDQEGKVMRRGRLYPSAPASAFTFQSYTSLNWVVRVVYYLCYSIAWVIHRPGWQYADFGLATSGGCTEWAANLQSPRYGSTAKEEMGGRKPGH
jgi:hypothetical protein